MSRKSLYCLFMLVVVILFINLPGSAYAQGEPPLPEDLVWVFTGGPRGGIGYDVRIHPLDNNIIWVTDAFAGAHQSTDGGQTWTARNEGIDARTGFSGNAIPIFSLTIDPHNPDIIWAGVQGARGLFKSTDGGQTWTRKDNGIRNDPQMEMRGITVDPFVSNIVYCGGNYLVNQTTQDQRGFIYKTTDGGETWKLLIEPDALVRWIIVDPTNTDIVYASTGIFDRFAVTPTGVLKSLDGGQTWTQINNGFNNLVVAALAMHPTDPLTLIAGTGKAGTFADEPQEINGGVFITHDGGANWQQVDPIKASGDHEIAFSAVAFSPSNPEIVYADAGYIFLRSENGGETWRMYDVKPGLAQGFLENRGIPIALTVHPTDPDTIYMNAYSGGVFLSTDGGKTWQDSSSGNSGAQVWGIALDPENPAFVVSASKNGVYLSFDSGGTWNGRNTGNEMNNIEAAAVDPSDRNNILIGRTIDGRMWRSTDLGFTWELVLGPLGEDIMGGRRAIHDIVFAPSAPEIVYAAAGIETISMVPPRSTIGAGVFKSLDGGATWAAVNGGLENTTMNILAIAVHPDNPDIVYLGEMNSGGFKSLDGGETWVPAGSGLRAKDIRSVAIDPQNPETIYAGAEFGGVWKSLDGGDSWQAISAGMPLEASVRAIVIDPTHTNIIYAADLQTGVYRSLDGGASWHQINNGLVVRTIYQLVISSDGQTLYAATEGNGVYRLDISGKPPEALPEVTLSDYLGIGDSPIYVDGANEDWEGRVIVYDDPVGDAEAGSLDLATGYAFRDEGVLYFLVETVEPEASIIQFDIVLTTGTQWYICSVRPGFASGYCADITNDYIGIGETTYSKFAFGPAFEGRIDLRDLGSPDGLQLSEITVMVGECCENPAWRTADSWQTGGTIPTAEESLVAPAAEPEAVEEPPAVQETEEQPPAAEETSKPLLPCPGFALPLAAVAGLAWNRRKF